MFLINKIRNKSEDITTDTTQVQRMKRDHYQWLYACKLVNLKEINQLLEHITYQDWIMK